MANNVFAPLLRSQMSRRLLVTAGILLVYRLGCQIPIPGLNTEALSRLSNLLKTETVSVLALGVTPFLSALLIFEFIKLIVPPLARWETANANNARRLSRYAYFVALIMGGLQARGVANALYGISGLLDGPGWEIPIAMTLVAGTALLGWLGDQITLRGVGNGFWLLLITPTLVNLPNVAEASYVLLQRGAMSLSAFFAAAVFLAAAVALVTMVCRSGGAETEHRDERRGFRHRLAAAVRNHHRQRPGGIRLASGGRTGPPRPDRDADRHVQLAAEPGRRTGIVVAGMDDNAGADFRLHRRRIVDASTVIADCDQRRLGHRRRDNRDELPAVQGFAPRDDDGVALCDLVEVVSARGAWTSPEVRFGGATRHGTPHLAPLWPYNLACLPNTRCAVCHSLRDSEKSFGLLFGGLCWVTSHSVAVARRRCLMVARASPCNSE